ncbi:hypothetical protein CJD36_016700 [Flavipsychrobacter stenotrophus]|uniref:HEPN AbiJ-N-terminal domain-containing protein n=1 Tax=Flavipsychrobacter stenotrophus TaxID=2077091 RepID=A0A2S7SS88_9BACT|nr:hypothetical protein [Flavipsychrobacter stenotrophus]PQJ09578.1 hypothetical protein CJD36_016700 [Flavipsychrobacter stenotrophus]
MESFSKRHGYNSVQKEIILREDAPTGLRSFLIQSLYAYGYTPKAVRLYICQTLRVAPDTQNNWGDDNVRYEIQDLIDNCDWFKIYDIIEALYHQIERRHQSRFTDEINEYFKVNGIGWKLEDGQITYRGEEFFEADLRKAEDIMVTAGLNTAKNEIQEAINDLSRRPIPDITGAIQHGVACLEVVAREIVGNRNETLGALIKQNRNIVPVTIDIIIEKIWGFSSEKGRHLKENGEPSFEEAELMVGLSTSIAMYLIRKNKDLTVTSTKDDLPF